MMNKYERINELNGKVLDLIAAIIDDDTDQSISSVRELQKDYIDLIEQLEKFENKEIVNNEEVKIFDFMAVK